MERFNRKLQELTRAENLLSSAIHDTLVVVKGAKLLEEYPVIRQTIQNKKGAINTLIEKMESLKHEIEQLPEPAKPEPAKPAKPQPKPQPKPVLPPLNIRTRTQPAKPAKVEPKPQPKPTPAPRRLVPVKRGDGMLVQPRKRW